ncbi:MAG: type II toxin-antitoxin system VapC family toxin [Cyanobacteria bacterium P01_F01_bin.143]
MIHAIADTHTIIWYLFADSRLSITARNTIEQIANNGNHVGIASISLAEIVYLEEKNRIPENTLKILMSALDQTNSVLEEIPLERNIITTLAKVERAQIPDLPDRIIAATALYFKVPVISRDHKIKLSSIDTIW